MKRILVTGGNGFIGSHMVDLLVKNHYSVIVIDNKPKLNLNSFDYEYYSLDLSDTDALDKLFSKRSIDAVMHFAGFIEVGSSITNPDIFYRNNLANTINLLNCMIRYDVCHIIFSSTAAVYGVPETRLLCEDHIKKPINPYGKTKWLTEQIFVDYESAFGLKHISLRYFNAAGAHINGLLGEKHNPETHLIPLILQVAEGKRQYISVYGDDYETKDGTCVRDYIHVMDVCEAHLLALQVILKNKRSGAYNLGTGSGYSVKEVIEKARQVTNAKIPSKIEPRRHGDPPYLIANPNKAMTDLNWKPKYSDLNTIIKTAWNFAIKL